MLTLFNGTPLLEVLDHNLLRLGARTRLLYPANVERPVLPREAANTTHVVSVVRKLVSRKAVLGGIGQRSGRVGKHVEVFAFPAVRTAPTGEEQAAVLDPSGICSCQAGIAFNVAACLGLCFAA